MIKRLIAFLAKAAGLTPLGLVPPAPDWTVLHRDSLARFLSSPTGQVLLARLTATDYENATNGCADQFHTVHSAGRASGYHDCIRHIVNLSQTSISPASGDSEANHDSTPLDAPEIAELYAP